MYNEDYFLDAFEKKEVIKKLKNIKFDAFSICIPETSPLEEMSNIRLL